MRAKLNGSVRLSAAENRIVADNCDNGLLNVFAGFTEKHASESDMRP